MKWFFILGLVVSVLAFGTLDVQAVDEYIVTIKDHKFIPEVVEIPVDTKVKLVIVNDCPTPE